MTGKSRGKEGIIPRIRVDMTSGYAIISLFKINTLQERTEGKEEKIASNIK